MTHGIFGGGFSQIQSGFKQGCEGVHLGAGPSQGSPLGPVGPFGLRKTVQPLLKPANPITDSINVREKTIDIIFRNRLLSIDDLALYIALK